MTLDDIKLMEKVNVQVGDTYEITFSNDISEDQLIKALEGIFNFEKDNDKSVYLNLKGLNMDLVSVGLKYAMNKEDLNDPIMLLNILNLVKVYNTLDDSFFDDEKIYVSSIEDLLDVKFNIHEDIVRLQKMLSIYFISLIKNYGKKSDDKAVELPLLYSNLIRNMDILTLSGIFSVSETFKTDECIDIKDSEIYINELIMKGSLSSHLIDMFVRSIEK